MILNIFIAAYLIGYFCFTLLADFGYEAEVLSKNQIVWNQVFGLWQQFSYGSIFAWAALFFNLKSFDRLKVKWVFIFSILLGIWQVISIYTGIDINDEWATIVAFLAVIGITVYLVIIEEIKARKWLNKNVT